MVIGSPTKIVRSPGLGPSALCEFLSQLKLFGLWVPGTRTSSLSISLPGRNAMLPAMS